jgi:hypothetical protein
MFMGLVMLLPIALLTGVGGWMAAFAMLKRGRSLRRPITWMAIVLAIALGALLLFNCLATETCRVPAGFEELAMRSAMIVAYAGFPLVPLVGGFLAGMVLGGVAWRMTNRSRA